MKKSDYTRTTVECRFEDFQPSFSAYLQKYLRDHAMEESELQPIACFETTSLKKGFWGRVKTTYTEIYLTQRFLFWAHIEPKKESGIAAAQWSEISELREWEDTQMAQLRQEAGIELFGFIYKWSKRSAWFMGLDKSEAAMKCRQLMRELMAGA